jgi:hypothetical protein
MLKPNLQGVYLILVLLFATITPILYMQLALGSYGAFTLDVKSVLNENLGGILGGTQC